MPASASRPRACVGLRRQLVGVVEVDVDVERVVLLQHGHELRRDPLRQEAGHARADADDLEVRDGPQPGQDALEPRVAQHERVAARDDDVADLLVGSGCRPARPRCSGDGSSTGRRPCACGCRTGSTRRSCGRPGRGSGRDSGGRCSARANRGPRPSGSATPVFRQLGRSGTIWR